MLTVINIRVNNRSKIIFKIIYIWIIITLFLSFELYSEDRIETVDGTVFNGKIVREDQKNVFVEINSGTVSISKDKIKNIKLQEKWDIEDHVTRVNKSKKTDKKPDEKPKPEQQKEDIASIDLLYFPLYHGNWWQYKVEYKPHSLYGKPLPEIGKTYEEVWRISKIGNRRKKSIYLGRYKNTGGKIFQLSIAKSTGKESSIKKIVFLGSLENDIKRSFLTLTEEKSPSRSIFYQRMVPMYPLLKENKNWVDFGQEEGVNLKSHYRIAGIEGMVTQAGYFDDCLLVEKVDEIEGQTLKSRTYFWFAPRVGMVRMIQEIIYPQTVSGDLMKSSVFQEYDLTNYEVKKHGQ